LLDGTEHVLSFVTIAACTIKFKDEELSLEINSGEKPKQIPGLKIARIGTISGFQEKGNGCLLIQSVVRIFQDIRKQIGMRYIVVDAVPEKAGWYKKRGFKEFFQDPTGHSTLPMYLYVGE